MSSRRTPTVTVALVAVLVAACDGAATPAAPSSTGVSAGHAGLGDFAAIPRTNLSLRVPDGMVVDQSIPGLSEPGARNSVRVWNVPMVDLDPRVALEDMANQLAETHADDPELHWSEVRRLTIADRPAVVTTGVPRASGDTPAKATAMLAADESVVMLTGTLQRGSSLSLDALREVLTSARWNDSAVAGGLGFDLTPVDGYRREETADGGVLLTLDGGSGDGVPELLATPSLGRAAVAEGGRRAFALSQFEGLPATPSAEEVTEVAVAGLSGFELTGTGSRAGEVVYAVVLFSREGHFVIAGDFDPATHPDQLPAFREMARSLVLS